MAVFRAEKIGNKAISNAYTYIKRQYLTYLIEYLMTYKIEITPGIDYSKMLIIKENDYIGPSSLINATQMVCFNKNVATIQQEIFEYLEGYSNNVTGINILHPSQFNRKYQFSTLKYFHTELGI